MKKERIVALCICVVLLGTLYAQWIAWACHFAMPSVARPLWSVTYGTQFRNGEESRKFHVRPVSLADFVCAGWPPLGFLYSEARLVKESIKNLYVQDGTKPDDIPFITMKNSNPDK